MIVQSSGSSLHQSLLPLLYGIATINCKALHTKIRYWVLAGRHVLGVLWCIIWRTVYSQLEEEHCVPSVHLPSSFCWVLCFLNVFCCCCCCWCSGLRAAFFFFSAAGRMLPTFSAASGCALGYFLINKRSIVLSQNTPEEYPQMYYTGYYGEYALL